MAVVALPVQKQQQPHVWFCLRIGYDQALELHSVLAVLRARALRHTPQPGQEGQRASVSFAHWEM